MELYISRTPDGDDVIVVDGIRPGCRSAWSIPISFCPICGRQLGGENE
nr:MAG TPA: zinc-ribbon containing domain protein [Caudoviricetes sp.]